MYSDDYQEYIYYDSLEKEPTEYSSVEITDIPESQVNKMILILEQHIALLSQINLNCVQKTS